MTLLAAHAAATPLSRRVRSLRSGGADQVPKGPARRGASRGPGARYPMDDCRIKVEYATAQARASARAASTRGDKRQRRVTGRTCCTASGGHVAQGGPRTEAPTSRHTCSATPFVSKCPRVAARWPGAGRPRRSGGRMTPWSAANRIALKRATHSSSSRHLHRYAASWGTTSEGRPDDRSVDSGRVRRESLTPSPPHTP